MRLAGPNELREVLPLVASYHEFEGVISTAQSREMAVRALLENPSLGEVWLIDAASGLAGYIAFCFSYSIEFGGRDAFIDEFFILPEMRGKGIGSQALKQACVDLKAKGIVAIHLEVDSHNRPAIAAYERLGFAVRDKYAVMSLSRDSPAVMNSG
jgi:ribosomal protein S18 acetylase RimI-like enzyme